jgi:hypothetical protein
MTPGYTSGRDESNNIQLFMLFIKNGMNVVEIMRAVGKGRCIRWWAMAIAWYDE